MKLVNYTTQSIVIRNIRGEEVTLEPVVTKETAPYVVKIKEEKEKYTDEGFVMMQTRYMVNAYNLPEPQVGVLFLVSQNVFNAFPERRDFVCSNTYIYKSGSRKAQGIYTLRCRSKVIDEKDMEFTPAEAI